MKTYSLNIANSLIRFESSSDGFELVPGERFRSFISSENGHDVFIRVHSGKYEVPENAIKVFDAPYVEEINGIRVKKSDKFWSIHKHNGDLFIKTVFPLSSENKNGVLKFSLSGREWHLWLDGNGKEADPLEYPLDGLVLYYLTAIRGDIMIHASGVNISGQGYIFSGVSGKGKTTMAKLWQEAGAVVIHDDRLILRKTGDGYRMFNTPVYSNDVPEKSPVNKIFLIGHGTRNEIIPVRGAAAVSMVLANCIQHNWDRETTERLLGAASSLCAEIPVFMVKFLPDKTIIDEILNYG